MRLRTPAALTLAVVTAALPGSAARADPTPACASSDAAVFPLATRLHGGPKNYEAGGDPGVWYLELTNTTPRTCAGIHPVVVLVDGARALKPAQPHLDFYVGDRPHPVRFETTDEDELVGAFEGPPGFPGFTVGPRRTVTVKVRLSVAAGAVPNAVTANAAVVQRHGDDGEWVGQSNDYRFTIGAGGSHPLPDEDPEADATHPVPDETPEADGTRPAPDGTPGADGTHPAPHQDTGAPSAAPSGDSDPSLTDTAAELARTGLGSPVVAFTAAALVVAGVVLRRARGRRR